MKFKTTIQITTDAADKNEAMEIVGEYLSGNLISGIDMKCKTHPAANHNSALIVASIACLIFMGGLVFSINGRHSSAGSMSYVQGLSAIQPPLKTSSVDRDGSRFKKEWQNKQSHKILDYIKR